MKPAKQIDNRDVFQKQMIARDVEALSKRPLNLIEGILRIHHRAIVEAVLDEMEKKDVELTRMAAAFAHTHVAHYEDGKLADACEKCGLDLRHRVHRASEA